MYLGEALITLAVIALIALLCAKSKMVTARCMEIMALLFTVGITVCFVAAMAGHGGTGMSMEPAFVPDKSALRQVLRIAFISPWAFIGFESVSHSAAEYRFKHSSMASLLALVLTSLIGLLRAVSRLCYAVAQDGILPERFSKLSNKQIPVNAILLVFVVSLPIPFLGRTAIG